MKKIVISILIILILSFVSVSFGAEYNPIDLNEGILEYYFNSWWTNCNVSKKIPRTQSNYDTLISELRISKGLFCWIGDGYEYISFLNSNSTLLLDSGYLKNVNAYTLSQGSMIYSTVARKMFNYSNDKYITTCNIYNLTTSGTLRLQANTQRGNWVTIVNDISISWAFQDSINSNTPLTFEIATTNYTTLENAIFKLYLGDSLSSGDSLLYIGDLSSTYDSSGYTIFAQKSFFSTSADYMIEATFDNGLVIYSDYAYIVVESSSSGGGGIIVVPSGDSGQITNTSGEVTGNVDMTGVQNRLDGVNQNLGLINDTIKAVPGEIAHEFYNSGDLSGDKGIIQKVYEDLFTISDDFIEDQIQGLKDFIGLSGDEDLQELETGYLSVFDETKKGDFRIHWNDFSLEDTKFIESGEINFSALERENESIQTIMFWVRTILGFSCFSLLIRQMWLLLLKTLGVATDIYEEKDAEAEAFSEKVYYNETTFPSGQTRSTTTSRRRIK